MKITFITLYWRDADYNNFSTLLLPSISRYFALDALDTYFIIYKTRKPVIDNPALAAKITCIPYDSMAAVIGRIKTDIILYISPNSCFIKPCFISDLYRDGKCLTTKDDNFLYYKKHLITKFLPQNNTAYVANLKRKGLYDSLYHVGARQYLSYKPRNVSEITRNYNTSLISLYHSSYTRYLTAWLGPQILAHKQLTEAEVNPLQTTLNFLRNEKIWMVSIGGVASNYLYSLIGEPMASRAYQLLCHYPRPLVTGNTKLKAIFLFDDIYHAIISQFTRGFQIPNIKKISNRNYNQNFVNMGLHEYANIGLDLFEVEAQFDAWTNPKPGEFDFEICCIKTSAIQENLDALLDFLGIKNRAAIKQKCNVRPFKKVQPTEKLRRLYAGLDAKIKKHPGMVIHKLSK